MAGSAGRSCTDDEVRIVRVYDDKRAEPDDLVPMDGKTPGEIIIFPCFKSTLTYPGNEELTKDKFYKGWIYTHDLGTWDKNQFITVSGRKDDMIISSGENIYPAQVEEAINCHPSVSLRPVGFSPTSRYSCQHSHSYTVHMSLRSCFSLRRLYCNSCT